MVLFSLIFTFTLGSTFDILILFSSLLICENLRHAFDGREEVKSGSLGAAAKALKVKLLLYHQTLQLTMNLIPGFGYPDQGSGGAYSLILKFLAHLGLSTTLNCCFHHAKVNLEILFGFSFLLPIA